MEEMAEVQDGNDPWNPVVPGTEPSDLEEHKVNSPPSIVQCFNFSVFMYCIRIAVFHSLA